MPLSAATALLVTHLLVAVTLLGSITHQALSTLRPAPAGAPSFLESFRGVRVQLYTNAIVALYVVMPILGGIIYPSFRNHVTPELIRLHLPQMQGVFDLKEHFVSIGLGTLPVYWYYWKVVPFSEERTTRAVLTTILMVIVWYAFIAGHLLNNIKGFGS